MLRDVSFPERGETWDGSQVSIRLRYSRIRTQYSWICIQTLVSCRQHRSNAVHARVVVRLQIRFVDNRKVHDFAAPQGLLTYLSCRRQSSLPASINLKTRGVTRRVADMAGTEERPRERGDDEKVKYPVGFRFDPTLKELVEFYLLPRLLDRPTVPNDAVIEADAYECDPEILTSKHHLTLPVSCDLNLVCFLVLQ